MDEPMLEASPEREEADELRELLDHMSSIDIWKEFRLLWDRFLDPEIPLTPSDRVIAEYIDESQKFTRIAHKTDRAQMEHILENRQPSSDEEKEAVGILENSDDDPHALPSHLPSDLGQLTKGETIAEANRLYEKFVQDKLTYREWNVAEVLFHRSQIWFDPEMLDKLDMMWSRGGKTAANREARKDLWRLAEGIVISRANEALIFVVKRALRASQLQQLRPYAKRRDVRDFFFRPGKEPVLPLNIVTQGLQELAELNEKTKHLAQLVTEIRHGTTAPAMLRNPPRQIGIGAAFERLQGDRPISYQQALSIFLNTFIVASWAVGSFYHKLTSTSMDIVHALARQYGTLEQRTATQIVFSYHAIGRAWARRRRPELDRPRFNSDLSPFAGKELMPWYPADRRVLLSQLYARLKAGQLNFRDWNLARVMHLHNQHQDRFATPFTAAEWRQLNMLVWRGGVWTARYEIWIKNRWRFALHVIHTWAQILHGKIRDIWRHLETTLPETVPLDTVIPYTNVYAETIAITTKCLVGVEQIRRDTAIHAALESRPTLLRFQPVPTAGSPNTQTVRSALTIHANAMVTAIWMGHPLPIFFPCIAPASYISALKKKTGLLMPLHRRWFNSIEFGAVRALNNWYSMRGYYT